MSSRPYSLSELAKLLKAELIGDGNYLITDIASIDALNKNKIAFFATGAVASLQRCTDGALLISARFKGNCQLPCLIVENPRLAFIKLLKLFRHSTVTQQVGIHARAVIGVDCQLDNSVIIEANVVMGDRVKLGANTRVLAGAVIQDDVSVGADCVIHNNVVLHHHITIGDRCEFYAGCVVGADGFGYEADENGYWHKVPQVGSVIIGNDVEVGANTCIDRGALNDTVIGHGVKIDDQVMIGHNVQIGDHTIIAGCAAIAGSTRIGRHCVVAGAACIADHLTICDGVVMTGMAMISSSIGEPGVYSSGTNFLPRAKWQRAAARFKQLDELAKTVKKLERQILVNANGDSDD